MTPILANAGTPLMMAMDVHLFLGNIAIGIIEGLIIAAVFKVERKRSCLFMVLANYFSMIIGFVLLPGVMAAVRSWWTGDVPIIYYATSLQVGLYLFAFLITIPLEWPCCRYILRKLPGADKKAWKASVIAQTASYLLLVPLYWAMSETSLATSLTLHDDTAFVRPPIATVYYIDPADGGVWRIETDGTGRERVLDAKIRDRHRALAFALAEDGQSWDLYLRVAPWPIARRVRLLAESFATGRTFDPSTLSEEGRVFPNCLETPDLRAEASPAWGIHRSFYGKLRATPEDRWGDLARLSFEIPYLNLEAGLPTILSSEQVVFELDGTIMLLDLQTRDLGVLTKGRGPAVIEPGETFNTWVDPEAAGETPKTKKESATIAVQ